MEIKKLSSSVQRKGQVTIPQSMRDAFGIRPGDEVYFRRLPEGILITTEKLERLAHFDETLAELSNLLAKKEEARGGPVELDDLLERIRERREEIVKEKYGLESTDA